MLLILIFAAIDDIADAIRHYATLLTYFIIYAISLAAIIDAADAADIIDY